MFNTAAAATLNVGPGQPYSTIQSAINAAAPGDTISVAAGTYNQSVFVYKQVTITGSGAATCIVAPSPTSTHVFNINSGGSNSSIDGFTITAASPAFSPVNIEGSNVSVTNCKMGGGSFGVTLQGGVNNSIANNEIYDSLYHCVLIWSDDNDVSNNTIRNTLTGNGLQVQAGRTGNLVHKNTITNCRQYGVYIYGTQNTVSENTITNNFGGIIIGPDANANHVLGNTINSNTDRAVFISSSDNVVDSNKASNNNGHSIIVYAPGTRNWINGNDVQYSGNNGIQLNWDTTANVVTNNNVQHSGTLALATGIYLTNASRSLIQDNNVGYSSEHGIEMDFDSPHNIIVNNVVAYSAAQGILSWECYDGGNEIRDNEVVGNGQTYFAGNGALQVHGFNNLISGNWVHDNKNSHGIALYPAGQWGIPGSYEVNGLTTHHNDVIGNTVSGLGDNNGIVLHTASNCVIKNNNAVIGLAKGIWIETGSSNGNLIYFNTFKGSRNLISRVGASNTWRSKTTQQYSYNGASFSSFVGNYWTDNTGTDADGNGINSPAYDLGDESDSFPLRQGITSYSGTYLTPYPTGDYNNNGAVDTADYLVWRKSDGTTNVLPNDPIGGTIGQAQYDQWKKLFGHTAGSGTGPGPGFGASPELPAAPEPPAATEPTPTPPSEAEDESPDYITDTTPQQPDGPPEVSGRGSYRPPARASYSEPAAAGVANAGSLAPTPTPTLAASEDRQAYRTDASPQQSIRWREDSGSKSYRLPIHQSSPWPVRGANARSRLPAPTSTPKAAEAGRDYVGREESGSKSFWWPIHQSTPSQATAKAGNAIDRVPTSTSVPEIAEEGQDDSRDTSPQQRAGRRRGKLNARLDSGSIPEGTPAAFENGANATQ